MISIIIFLAGLFFSIFIFIRNNNTNKTVKQRLVKPLSILILSGLVSAINPFQLERVDAGHVGIKVNLTGDARGISKFEYKTGWVVYNTWISRLYEFPTYQQHIDYPEQSVITKGGFEATIKPSFNYSLIPGSIGEMFQNLRLPVKEVEQGWLKTLLSVR
ncbi:MAG: SPFH domain-containing protein [Agriterribacter sp.]